MIEDVRRLLQAEVFADFLEMAEHLLDNGYKDPAAVLQGAVLEDSLKKARRRERRADNSIERQTTDDRPVKHCTCQSQKCTTHWSKSRSHPGQICEMTRAHGNFSKYADAQVRMMLLFVQKFCADYLR